MAENPTPERILFILKTRGPQSIGDLGKRLGMSAEAARQHLFRLRDDGLVETHDEPSPRGRPKRFWRLSESGHARFPDSHANLTLELIGAVRELYGEEGLERLIAKRETETLESYRLALKDASALGDQVARLAEVQSCEGYMAEAQPQEDGSWLLAENHCPICVVAASYQGFCRSELEIFRQALGPEATVERTDHILAGARRCAYVISGPL